MRYLVVGLGNPGKRYEWTRHNVGFLVVDELSRHLSVLAPQKKFKGLLLEGSLGEHRVLALKPQTFMNLSGESVQETVNFYKIPPESHLIVVSDDLDLPLGTIRIRPSGGTGGHNGLKSITSLLGTDRFCRVRIGIGRSDKVPTESYVLTEVSGPDLKPFKEAVERAAHAVRVIIEEGIQIAMNQFNKRENHES